VGAGEVGNPPPLATGGGARLGNVSRAAVVTHFEDNPNNGRIPLVALRRGNGGPAGMIPPRHELGDPLQKGIDRQSSQRGQLHGQGE